MKRSCGISGHILTEISKDKKDRPNHESNSKYVGNFYVAMISFITPLVPLIIISLLSEAHFIPSS